MNTNSKDNKKDLDTPGDFGRSKVSFAVICTAGLALLLCLVFFYMKQDPPPTPEAVSEASVAQAAVPQAEQPQEYPAQQNPQSEEGAREVLSALKRFQGATESSMGYDEYDEMLTHLKADLDSALPAFGNNPSDETFRQEVLAAVRDYTAAGNWWKTTIRNSSVFGDADRKERTQAIWTSAKTHLDNAEKMLAR